MGECLPRVTFVWLRRAFIQLFPSAVEESSEMDDQADDSAVEHPTSNRFAQCRMYVYHNGMKASDIDGRYGANLGQRSSFHAGVG